MVHLLSVKWLSYHHGHPLMWFRVQGAVFNDDPLKKNTTNP